MKNKSKYLIGVTAVVAIILIIYALGNNSSPGQYDDFAKCLTEKDVKMYGAYWCSHCANQKKEFGSGWKYVNYIECSLPNNAGQTELCKQASIGGYPTWEFTDGSRLEGEVSLFGLGQKAGCELP